MGDKRDFNAFCGAADITLCGLPHAEGAKYVPPTAEVMAFALEKGFAVSGDTDNKQGNTNDNPSKWERATDIETFDWN